MTWAAQPGNPTARQQPSNLEELLDLLGVLCRQHDRVSFGAIVQIVGQRSFGPLLLVAGLIVVSPLSGIPGLPTTVAVLVILIAVQLLLRRSHFWLPQWLARRKISRDRFCKALGVMRRPARFVDRFLRPRLEVITDGGGVHLIAVVCIVIAMALPPLEFVPFSATIAGVVLTTYGLALTAHDGLVGLIALLLTGAAAGLIVFSVV